jgi:hypothetical protein
VALGVKRRSGLGGQKRIASSGSSQVEKGTGNLPCLRRLKRSSSARGAGAGVDRERRRRIVKHGVDSDSAAAGS